GGPRDLAAIAAGLAAGEAAAAALAGPLPAWLDGLRARLAVAPGLHARLTTALATPAPLRLEEGAIASGFDGELDAERALRDDSRRVIATLQLDFAQQFGVASLKIRHHAQLGYVIEAPAAAVERLREQPELVLRQGMANGARFTHPALSELDRRINAAAERAAAREAVIFATLVTATLAHGEALAGCAAALAGLDVAQAAARLATGGRWCCPEMGEDTAFEIIAGRHPVVEAALAGGAARFVANDCTLDPGQRLLLLTGPNMAGKSTYLRQNALIAILAQAGLPVPAQSARIGIVDRLFSRVGAADDLARGRSTFMVEMTETAAILRQAGPRSLVVVDEIGRGTATLDGLAIAWAVLEALHNTTRCRTLFATHFHELAELTAELPNLAPHSMRVKEWKGSVVFLHEVARGAAGRSWGVHVAQLAGIPPPVVRRAAALLAALEARAGRLTGAAALPLFAAALPDREEAPPAAPAEEPRAASADALAVALAALDPDRMTPREAHEALYRLQAMLPVAAEHEAITSD
ncbi:MAG: DNA mismatch repair protein MutS, partial [Rhodospirillales bacterium]|nr:DNA mismatch repair protein MutS [Rhodospirillales bacterium]